ncbi:hypothetical protein LfeInf_043 [Lactobacillus phage LfeInf]|uniref:Uncharacterized protein n=1 Tax=Lactobacillus phage LfeInf TaxID=1567484 RepID=A0A0A7NP00_9CAUD|nr:hypothetical protein AXJ15_gp119 [Lactobacillus phage LfeInf]AIZ94669.1 hypothetical protein LfeInf_043 [Lactobacillus phage LfeInf]
MEYLTKNFYSKRQVVTSKSHPNIDTKGCVKKLNKWLAKPDQQDVKVDHFIIKPKWGDNVVVNGMFRCTVLTQLTIIYHHE